MLEEIKRSKIVPVVVLEDKEDAVPLAKALLKGGITSMEITFRTDCACEAILEVVNNVPEMHVGAGTILNIKQCRNAIESGAKFIVSPGLNEEVVRYCTAVDIPVLPGAVTPTEIMKARELGLNTVKFFPANVYGGLKAIKALSAPFRDMYFLPTGGINKDNLNEYLSCNQIIAVGGSWICPDDLIRNKKFDRITELCKESLKETE